MEQAEEFVRQGKAWAEAGEYARAEAAYRKALSLCEAGSRSREAYDLCLTLAELNMEQGNMHGADVWYVRALEHKK